MKYYFSDMTYGDEFCEMMVESTQSEINDIVAHRCAEELPGYLGHELDYDDLSNWPRIIGISKESGTKPEKIFQIKVEMQPNYYAYEIK